MFGRDVYILTKVNVLLPKLGYLGDTSMFSLEMFREAYMMAGINLKKARDRQSSHSERGTQIQSWGLGFITES